MTARRLSLLLTTLVLAGCTDTVGGRATAKLSLPVHDFPDRGGFSEIDSGKFYVRDGNPEYGFVFTTPAGLVCGMGSFPGWQSAGAECTGARPDKGPGLWTVDAERFGPTTIQTSVMPSGALYPSAHPNKLLPQRHYVIDSADTMCLVTQDSSVACHVGEHGFILTAGTTTLF